MASHSTSTFTNAPATSSRKGGSRPHGKSSKPRSLLITHAAKKALVPVQRRSSLRMEILVPHMLDKSRYNTELRDRKNLAKISAELTARCERALPQTFHSGFSLGPSTRSSASRPVSVFSTLSGAAPVTPKPIRSLGRPLHWAHDQPFKAPGYKSVAQMMGTRPFSVTARALLLYKQKRKWSKWISDNDAQTQGHPDLEFTVPFEPIGTPPRAPSAPLPRHPEFACPPKMKAVRAPFDHRKKVTRRTPADYLRMHHLAWKELKKDKIAKFAQRTDKIIVDELDLPWSIEAMAMDVVGGDEDEEMDKQDDGDEHNLKLAGRASTATASPKEYIYDKAVCKKPDPSTAFNAYENEYDEFLEQDNIEYPRLEDPLPTAQDECAALFTQEVLPLDLQLDIIEDAPIDFPEVTFHEDTTELVAYECTLSEGYRPFSTTTPWWESLLLGPSPTPAPVPAPTLTLLAYVCAPLLETSVLPSGGGSLAEFPFACAVPSVW